MIERFLNKEEGHNLEPCGDTGEDGDLSEMLEELRILLPGAQLFTAFLITLPFNAGFRDIVQAEKWIFMATFIFSLSSLVLFAAPAIQHRLMRPLRDRVAFKNFATQQIVAGAATLSLALVLSAELVVGQVFGHLLGLLVAGLFAILIGSVWWLFPRVIRKRICRL